LRQWLDHPSPLDPTVVIASALSGETPSWINLSPLLTLAMIACVAIALVEGQGYDRLDAATPGSPSRTAPVNLSLRPVQRFLFQRERGRIVTSLVWIVPPILSAGLALTLRHFSTPDLDPIGSQAAVWISIFVAQFGGTLAITQAARSVARDVLARPLLAP